jgi:restriction system protein
VTEFAASVRMRSQNPPVHPDSHSNAARDRFERLAAEAFRRRGFTVTGFGGRSGAQLALRKGRERFLVDLHHWRKSQVGVMVVRQLEAIIRAVGASGGFVITMGDFTREARALALRARIVPIDGRNLDGGWLTASVERVPVPLECPEPIT